ncbi:MAG: hypothetical protein II736_07620 [Clostridia bacterium]|nr:hypothetical protein [Clostridia bacterium]
MIKIERCAVMNMEGAIRGARNPLNSWAKSDSYTMEDGTFVVGDADRDLGHRLALAGSDHRKFLRQVIVSVDITAPLYWWKEFDTYKVGTVANSTSTMHKIHSKEFGRDDFSHDKMSDEALACLDKTIEFLEASRKKFVETKEKKYWDDMIQILPSSFNQMRTVSMNYENLVNMYYARRNHKLTEWHEYCAWIETLPLADDWIIVKDE